MTGPSGQRALSALLLLADGRFPAGGHAHSGGMEAALAMEGIDDIEGLEAFLRGRAATSGAMAAAAAAMACAALAWSAGADESGFGIPGVILLDQELDARMPSPALRQVSRRLGRQLLRAGREIWPHPHLDSIHAAMPDGPHQPVVLGAVAAVAGVGVDAVATAAVHEAVTGPATAAVRLLGLDPFAVHAVLARLGPDIDAIAADAALHARSPPADLPARGAPLLDMLAERHATWEVRLFAS